MRFSELTIFNGYCGEIPNSCRDCFRDVDQFSIGVFSMAEIKSELSAAAFSPDRKLLAIGGSRIEVLHALGKQQRVINLPQMRLSEIDSRAANTPNGTGNCLSLLPH